MQLRVNARLLLLIGVLAASGCARQTHDISRAPAVPPSPTVKPLPDNAPPQLKQMLDGAIAQAGVTTGYDPAYVALDYPGGDVDEKTGVCSDVVVRALRKSWCRSAERSSRRYESGALCIPEQMGRKQPGSQHRSPPRLEPDGLLRAPAKVVAS